MPRYLCHVCNAHVDARVNEEDHELYCTQCQSTFIEQVEDVPTQPQIRYGVIPASQERNTPEIRYFSAVIDDQKVPDMFSLMSNMMGGLFSSSGMFQLADIQMIRGSMEDYGIGSNFSDILEYIRSTQPDRFGRPPASEDVIGSLADFQISEENKDDSKLQACAICQDSFEVGETIKRLPCEHYFHANCIIPWLKQCNSCPVCRAPLSNSEE